MRTHVIIAAAGEGTRLQASKPKPLLLLEGKPILQYSLETFAQCPDIVRITICAPLEHVQEFEQIIAQAKIKIPVGIVQGGATRMQSVAQGLKTLDPNCDFVLIHDAARPFISLEVIKNAISACQQYSAVSVAVPVISTIKRVDASTQTVSATLDRSILWEVQTPQVFAKELILQAHRQGVGLDSTDDAFLVERFGGKVRIVRGEYRNIKITTPEDLLIAQALLKGPASADQ